MSDEPITDAHLNILAAEMEGQMDDAIAHLRDEMESRIRDLQTEVDRLQTQVDDLQGEVDGL